MAKSKNATAAVVHRRPNGQSARQVSEVEISLPIEAAIGMQQMRLWNAQAMIETIAIAVRHQFEGSSGVWPDNLPHFDRVLFEASRIVEEAADALESSSLEKVAALEVAQWPKRRPGSQVRRRTRPMPTAADNVVPLRLVSDGLLNE